MGSSVRRFLRACALCVVLALAVVPAATASHLTGFGHDNNAAGSQTSLICVADFTCLIASNTNPSDNARGMRGEHTASSGIGAGVHGETNSTSFDARGVVGVVAPADPGPFSAGVRGMNNGTSGAGIGVYGSHAGAGFGVYGTAQTGGRGVVGEQKGGGTTLGYGGYFVATSTGASSAGVRGDINSNAANAAGVMGFNNHLNCCGMGVAGFHTGQGIGVYGESPNGFALSGFSPNNWSLYLQGNARVVGNLQKNSGSFTIDHPLDPANKYLSHSFVESPDMLNVYNGNVRTNRRGFATVKLPRYFGALNRSFRYQLTSLSGLQDVAVAEKIKDNRFVIQSERPFSEVSWQVTGIRKDAWANAHRIKVEEAKTGSEAGKYLNPELYGKPLTKSVVVLPGMDKTSPRIAERRPAGNAKAQ